MIKSTVKFFRSLLSPRRLPISVWQPAWSHFLDNHVIFYHALSESNKREFERRCIKFLALITIESRDDDITDEDNLLIAASAVIPMWAFPGWQYTNLDTVHILPSAFNEEFLCFQPDSTISGMVGNGSLSGKMILSREDLHMGFASNKDRYNVGIHEFAHLIDMADGKTDGVPTMLMRSRECSTQWQNFVAYKINAIESGQTTIRPYAATNEAEFFAVASEFFFEQPATMLERYPALYESLQQFYKQDVLHIEKPSAR
ncbi:Protein MtfA [BD1-7 clade bacterium]|uniref:Protein MtfA n=1 Tax=BD1-7 clade bacterium TaxID=2029982 RepID=A0A5S9PGB2_9GAMM|nr:Protein MtfA [BD1-7 clade bacterium]